MYSQFKKPFPYLQTIVKGKTIRTFQTSTHTLKIKGNFFEKIQSSKEVFLAMHSFFSIIDFSPNDLEKIVRFLESNMRLNSIFTNTSDT